jgi:SIR2-like domain
LAHSKTPGLPRHHSVTSFVDQLALSLAQGNGLVLLAGAGVSASAGVPTITQLAQYLQRCIGLSLGVDVDLPNDGNIQKRRWHPRTDAWPPLWDPRRPADIIWYDRIEREWRRQLSSPAWNPETRVFQEALGALAEWRSSLQFLSRITTTQKTYSSPDEAFLDVPDQELVDAFFIHVTRGRTPSLVHRMIALLTRMLRSHVILTTNFDELIEQAFNDNGAPLNVLDVQLHGGLPPPVAFRGSHTLIKLHGGRFGLRGDYSLDAKPSEIERHRFIECVVGHPRSEDRSHTSYPPGRNNLLIMGLSAHDRRLRYFIRDAVDQLRTLKVFWLCYTSTDLSDVMQFAERIPTGAIIPQRFTDLGLFLQHLYQVLCHTLPPVGCIFPSVSRLPFPPEPVRPLTNAAKTLSTKLQYSVLSVNNVAYSGHRIVVLTSPRNAHGVTTIAASAFDALRDGGDICVWLDMNDFGSTDDFFEQLLDAVSHITAIDDWASAWLERDSARRAGLVRRILQSTGKRWVFFLNCRETPGSNFHTLPPDKPNGWLDIDRSDAPASVFRDESACHESFLDFLEQLCAPGSPNTTAVLLARNPRTDGEHAALFKDLETRADSGRIGCPPDKWLALSKSCVSFDTVQAVLKSFRWASRMPERQSFLLLLVLIQRTRFLATFFDHTLLECIGAPSERAVTAWLRALEALNVLKWKPGGFVWLHTPVRNALRSIYAFIATGDVAHLHTYSAHAIYIRLAKTARTAATISAVASLHYNLAHWYSKLFAACRRPGALFEALYHALESVRVLLDRTGTTTPTPQPPPRGRPAPDPASILRWASAQLCDGDHTVRTTGFSKSSCRRLSHLLATTDSLLAAVLSKRGNTTPRPLVDHIREFQKQCLKTMRGIAKEVSEITTCFERHRQLRSLVVTGKRNELQATASPSVLTFAKRKMAMTRAFRLWALGHDEDQDNLKTPTSKPRQHLWLRWWRWAGSISIAARSLGKAEEAFMNALGAIVPNSSVHSLRFIRSDRSSRSSSKGRSAAAQLAAFDSWLDQISVAIARNSIAILGKPASDVVEARKEVVAILEQYAQLMLLWSQLQFRCNHSSKTWLGAARMCIERAYRILDLLSDSAESSSVSTSIAKSRIKLRSHLAIVEATAGAAGGARGSTILNDAELEFTRFDPRREGTSWARMSLHRAEIAIIAARMTTDRTGTSFAGFNRSILQSALSSGLRSALRYGRKGQFDQQVNVYLRDAAIALEQAQRVLITRRKSVWWSTWLFQRRLHLVECRLWLSLVDCGTATPIPYLGLEAAPRLTETLAEELLREARKMVRLDSYRLATVVETYSHCVLALRCRLLNDTSLMPLRERAMWESLDEAVRHLARVHDERKAMSHGPVSERIGHYVKSVITKCHTILDLTRF